MFRLTLLLSFILITVSTSLAQSSIGSCPLFPADSIWNTPVDHLPLHANSAAWVSSVGTSKGIHPEFGSGLYNGVPMGIPFITVRGTQTKYPATFYYPAESDPGPYAIPLNAPREGGSDHHVIAVDTDNCILYEIFNGTPQTASWSAGSGAIFNLRSNALRTAGWTSADAAGLPILAGLGRYDEIVAGEKRHALRGTVPPTQQSYIWPARHWASKVNGSQYPPMGARFRLRADYDISRFSATNQIILRAIKKYGMLVADNGASWFITGTPDSRWDNDDLHNLLQVVGSNMEAVDSSSLMIDPNSGQAKQAGTVSVAVSPATASVTVKGTRQFAATVVNGTSQLVNWSVNGTAGGNSTVGFVSTTGMYTAPAVPPSGGTVKVQAASAVLPSAMGTATVTITSAPPASTVPTLTSITPASGAPGSIVMVTLKGSNFTAGASLAIADSSISAMGVSVVSSSQITATLVIIKTAALGARNISVVTSAGKSAALPFTVAASTVPTLTSISPNAIAVGSSAKVTLTGTNFASPAVPWFSVAGITAANVVVVSPTSITATISVGAAVPRQSAAMVVSAPAGVTNVQWLTVQ
jgi:hypothetical protein